eukprot:gb/GECH01009800.1/.p1 GENE.gb/GECH01009800.1/~~gb/GECH01009800.1/.p1  ORF type:complete len:528 (+),score=137.41 gb/GECH01009800.1/:1-1584(+)
MSLNTVQNSLSLRGINNNNNNNTTKKEFTTSTTKDHLKNDRTPLIRVTVTNTHSGSRILPFSDRVLGPYSFSCHFTAHKINPENKFSEMKNNNNNNSHNNNKTENHYLNVLSSLSKTIPNIRLIQENRGIQVHRENNHMVGFGRVFSRRSVEVELDDDHESLSSNDENHDSVESMDTFQLVLTLTSDMRMHEDRIPYQVEMKLLDENVSTKLIQHEKIKDHMNPPKDTKHLIFLVHGLNGSRNDLHYIYEQLTRHIIHQVHSAYVMVPTVNHCLTREGVIPNGERIAHEILSTIDKIDTPDKDITLSLVGYSLGGLLIRYASGWLQDHYPEKWDSWRKLNFITFASPHVSGKENIWPIRLGAPVIGSTGREIMLRDHAEKPLLLEMSQPGTCFMAALESFENRRLYSNIKNDPLVGYCTGAIRAENPFLSRLDEFRDPVVIIDEDEENENDGKHNSDAYQSWIRTNTDNYIVEMLQNLNRISWKRSAVYFSPEVQENAHRSIVVRREILNHMAKPVIDHFINKFVFN